VLKINDGGKGFKLNKLLEELGKFRLRSTSQEGTLRLVAVMGTTLTKRRGNDSLTEKGFM